MPLARVNPLSELQSPDEGVGRGKEGPRHRAWWAPDLGVPGSTGGTRRHEDPAGRAGSLGTLAQRSVPGEEGQGMPGISLGSSPLEFPKLSSHPQPAARAGSEESPLDIRAAAAPRPRTEVGSSVARPTGNRGLLPANLLAQQDEAPIHLPGQQGDRQTDGGKTSLPVPFAPTSFLKFLSDHSSEGLCTRNSKDFTHALNLRTGCGNVHSDRNCEEKTHIKESKSLLSARFPLFWKEQNTYARINCKI